MALTLPKLPKLNQEILGSWDVGKFVWGQKGDTLIALLLFLLGSLGISELC